MRPVSWKEFAKVAVRLGWRQSRQEGSHIVFTKPGARRSLVVPCKHKDLATFVLKANLRTMGITESELLDHLDKL